MAQVHRFRDSVAAYLGDGQTVYMTPDNAEKLAEILTACARDVRAGPFRDSQFRTVELGPIGEESAGAIPPIARNPDQQQ